jgi:hypothetical protein
MLLSALAALDVRHLFVTNHVVQPERNKSPNQYEEQLAAPMAGKNDQPEKTKHQCSNGCYAKDIYHAVSVGDGLREHATTFRALLGLRNLLIHRGTEPNV